MDCLKELAKGILRWRAALLLPTIFEKLEHDVIKQVMMKHSNATSAEWDKIIFLIESKLNQRERGGGCLKL